MINPDLFSVLTLTRLQIYFTACEHSWLPDYLGTTLRGAFGHCIKEIGCPLISGDCQPECQLPDHCLYAFIFETKRSNNDTQEDLPRPFIFVPPASVATEKRIYRPGDELSFGLILIGQAGEYIPQITAALQSMGEQGLGAGRFRFLLDRIAAIDLTEQHHVIYQDYRFHEIAIDDLSQPMNLLIRARMNSLGCNEKLRLDFLTPIMLRVGKKILKEIDFQLLIKKLQDRIYLLAELYGDEYLEISREIINIVGVRISGQDLRENDRDRFSNKQQQKLNYSFLEGYVQYEGAAIREWWPLIIAGEFLQVGKHATFGLGRYRISTDNS